MAVGHRYYDSPCSCGTAYAVVENKLTKGATHETFCTNHRRLIPRARGGGARSFNPTPISRIMV